MKTVSQNLKRSIGPIDRFYLYDVPISAHPDLAAMQIAGKFAMLREKLNSAIDVTCAQWKQEMRQQHANAEMKWSFIEFRLRVRQAEINLMGNWPKDIAPNYMTHPGSITHLPQYQKLEIPRTPMIDVIKGAGKTIGNPTYHQMIGRAVRPGSIAKSKELHGGYIIMSAAYRPLKSSMNFPYVIDELDDVDLGKFSASAHRARGFITTTPGTPTTPSEIKRFYNTQIPHPKPPQELSKWMRRYIKS